MFPNGLVRFRGLGGELILCDDPALYPTSWSPDGKVILMLKTTGGNASDSGIFALPLIGDRKPRNTSATSSLGRSMAQRSKVLGCSRPGLGGDWPRKQIEGTGGSAHLGGSDA
jgi:hypothetical protein